MRNNTKHWMASDLGEQASFFVNRTGKVFRKIRFLFVCQKIKEKVKFAVPLIGRILFKGFFKCFSRFFSRIFPDFFSGDFSRTFQDYFHWIFWRTFLDVLYQRVLEFEYLQSYLLDKFDIPNRASIHLPFL